MPPHGPGLYGAAHSHDPEYPDDSWNLYSMLDQASTTALNVTVTEDAISVFKPFVHRLSEHPRIISDADAEILVVARFISPVHVRKLMVVGGGDLVHHPTRLRCYVNHENIDFTNLEELRPDQEFHLPQNVDGTIELTTNLMRFSNVTSLAFFFPENFGSEQTVVQYIGLQGEHTHYRREAVDTFYEVLCNGQDISHTSDHSSISDISQSH